MRGRSTTRFLLEVAFLVIVAAVAAGLHFGAAEIGLTMAGAFVLVVVAEVATMRDGSGDKPRVQARPRTTAPKPDGALTIDWPSPPAVAAPAPVRRDEVIRVGSPAGLRTPGETPRPPVVVPPPPPEPVPEPPLPTVRAEPKPEPQPELQLPTVQVQPDWQPPTPVQWNLFELQSRARAVAGRDPGRDEEWSFLFLYLRDFADSAGLLPLDFDSFVRESFPDLLGGPR